MRPTSTVRWTASGRAFEAWADGFAHRSRWIGSVESLLHRLADLIDNAHAEVELAELEAIETVNRW